MDVLAGIKEVCQSHAVDGCDECQYHNYWDKWDETITCQFSRVPGNWAVEKIGAPKGVQVKVVLDADDMAKRVLQSLVDSWAAIDRLEV